MPGHVVEGVTGVPEYVAELREAVERATPILQRMTEDPVEMCETCGQPVTKVLHSPAVHFKGSGFYNTDYGTRKRSRELKSAAEGGSSKDGDKGSDSKKPSDSKGESKGSSSTSGSSPD